jgi:hypothetical protein
LSWTDRAESLLRGLRDKPAGGEQAIAAGESAEAGSWQVGHKNSVVTGSIYVQEIKSVERSARRRARLEARYGGLLERRPHERQADA